MKLGVGDKILVQGISWYLATVLEPVYSDLVWVQKEGGSVYVVRSSYVVPLPPNSTCEQIDALVHILNGTLEYK